MECHECQTLVALGKKIPKQHPTLVHSWKCWSWNLRRFSPTSVSEKLFVFQLFIADLVWYWTKIVSTLLPSISRGTAYLLVDHQGASVISNLILIFFFFAFCLGVFQFRPSHCHASWNEPVFCGKPWLQSLDESYRKESKRVAGVLKDK